MGQPYKEIDGKKYILIGNEQQLRAIGSGKKVMRPIYKCTQNHTGLGSWTIDESTVEPVYAGDADLDATASLWDDQSVPLAGAGVTSRTYYFTYDDKGERVEARTLLANNADTGLTYSSDANYIIFRDIDAGADAASGTTSGAAWTPLMFSGTMLGAVSGSGDAAGSLWGCIGTDGVSVNDTAGRPTISNVNVRQTGKLDVSKYTGIGFFGTVAHKLDDSDPFANAASPAYVSNVRLVGVSVRNEATEVDVDQTIVSGLLQGVGKLLEVVLDPVLKLLGLSGMQGLIENLLTIRAADPSSLATGAFAGRVVGKVTITDCAVEDVSVSNAASMTGGFVGYVTGETRYSFASDVLGGTSKLLTNLLNIIPGLGLGDLITLLLNGNVIKSSELIPIAYSNATLTGCTVTDFAEGTTLGSADKDYAGGFVGLQVGTVGQGCAVTSANAFSVRAHAYAGGFAGLMRNDEMRGALSQLGVDLPSLAIPQSAAVASTLKADVTVQAVSCAGGFAGAMAASFAVNDTVDGALSVSATGAEADGSSKTAYVGGFAGAATLGWGMDLGAGADKNASLLSGVSNLLTTLLNGGQSSEAQDLLSLAGVDEAEILGARMSGTVTVSSGNDYAGGMVGKGTGTVIATSDAAHVGGLSFWKHGRLTWDDANARATSLEGLASVSAQGSYAGGIAGELQPAAIAGLLNDTLGLGQIGQKLGDGQFKMFELADVTLAGTDAGASVSADGYYAGGAIGLATGGDVTKTTVINMGAVSAKGEAGGFIGFSGPSSALGAGGISLLGLIEVSGLLSVAQYSSVTVRDASVAGVATGMDVSATGRNEADETNTYAAGGFFGQANSTRATSVRVSALRSVTADSSATDGAAGGFVGISTTGGLIDAIDSSDDTTLLQGLLDSNLISVDNLLGAGTYLVPNYKAATVSFVNGGSVSADIAGGFAGDFQGGKLNVFTDDELTDDATLADVKAAVEAAPVSVTNVDHVSGGTYAGGWGGRVTSGALAQAGKGGLSLLGGLKKAGLNVDVAQLVTAVSAYVPLVSQAGVHTDATTVEKTSGAQPSDPDNPGLVVLASGTAASDSQSGSAGGFIGYGSGVQVSASSVTQLRHTKVSEPADLEGADGSSYFDDARSSYAVSAPRYAGGYIGHMDVGSAASVGDGLTLFGDSLSLTDVLGVVQAVVSTIEHSDVTGGTGGFAVRATSGATGAEEGDAGGFAGRISGGHVQDSSSENFSYVVAQVSAGGYAGTIEPGDVARVLGSINEDGANSALGTVLKGLVNTNGSLASLLQDFVPTVRNSYTTSIPCGGAVRAQAASTSGAQRGMAGGYVGHNLGGHVWGSNNAPWSSAAAWDSERGDDNLYTGTQNVAAAVRIRSVWGAEMAGGFTGFMEPSDTAKTGSVSLLFGLVKLDNLLGALQVAYPTEENTQVTGPLRGIRLDTWNAWVKAVGAHGYYGQQFKAFDSQEALDAYVAGYAYGTNVVAGRSSYDVSAATADGGVAGGYVGLMRGGTITNGQALDTKAVSAMRAAGGFAGRAETGGAVELGSVSVLGLKLSPGQLLSALQVLVPVIKSSGTQGFRSGLTVRANGTDLTHELGFAGGFVGYASGAQLWGDKTFDDAGESADRWNIGATHEDAKATGLFVSNLRRVSGTNCVGGFAGLMTAAGVADVNTNASDETGLLQKVLDSLVQTPNDLAQVIDATVSTVRGAHVSAPSTAQGIAAGADLTAANAAAAWGLTVDGAYEGADGAKAYARAAGGFAGSMKAVVAGTKDRAAGEADTTLNTLTVTGLRGVEGGQYAGGFFGQADIESVASVAGSEGMAGGDQSTELLLGLLKLGNVSALDAFRTYVYHAGVTAVADGLTVRAHDSSTQGILDSTRYTGAAGGFGGALVNGTVESSAVMGLASVQGVNYAGGFVGHLGKAGTVDAEGADLKGLLGATAGVLDIWGSHVDDSSVSGIADGYAVTATHGSADYGLGSAKPTGREVAGGFAGYADLARVKGCSATNLKKVSSGEVAGGFVGETNRAYLVDAQVSSVLLDVLLKVVDTIVRALYLGKAQDLGVIDIGGWFPAIKKVIDVKVLAEGQTVYVNLFGLKVGVALDRRSETDPTQTDVAIVTIGDSKVELPCTKDGISADETAKSNLTVQLIKGNRTRVEGSQVSGIRMGYDVFGGSASQEADGTENLATGYAGGFAGLNDEGVLAGNAMTYADTIRGTSGLVDPFAYTTLKSVWDFNAMADILGEKDGAYNTYRIYREANATLATAMSSNSSKGTGTSYAFASREADAQTGLDAFTVSLFEPVDASGAVSLNAYDGTVPTSGAAGDAAATWLGIRGAVRQSADGTQSQALDAYVSPAKAVLMRDTPVTDSTGSLTPEPGEGQDPCDTYADLTLVKVWNDQDDKAGLRPDSVTFTVTATYRDANGTTVTPQTIVRMADGTPVEVENPIKVTLTKADAATWSDTWRQVVAGLPVAFDDGSGTPRYYSYTVGEPQLPEGYTSAQVSTADDFTTTVTNTRRQLLPDTGGMGTFLLGIVAAALVALGTCWEVGRRRRASVAAAGAHVAAAPPRRRAPGARHGRPASSRGRHLR